MSFAGGFELSPVEVRPEVTFLYELLNELTSGRLRIPRFQRPFVWRRDQMTDLLDSVYKQYPIGSLLVWETDEDIATLDRLGPFVFPQNSYSARVGYVLDGHQRLSTLAGALAARPEPGPKNTVDVDDAGRWTLCWNMENAQFEHGDPALEPTHLFPCTALLDTLSFFQAIEQVRTARNSAGLRLEDQAISQISEVARAFQSYRVPVTRIKHTGLSEAVEIFARLNSKGSAMSADQMVSALMYRQGDNNHFDLASEIDGISENLLERWFDVDRTTLLRAVLANIDEDIYRTDWTGLATHRRNELLPRLQDGASRTRASVNRAVDFLNSQGIYTGRLLPYAMQIVVLSAFFDKCPKPDERALLSLRRWFWVSSFSGWFGIANPSRINSLVGELRQVANDFDVERLRNFDAEAEALPFPATFDMRSARTRSLLLVMLSLAPRDGDGSVIEQPWLDIAGKGPEAVGRVFGQLPQPHVGNPANRVVRPPGAARGTLRSWLERAIENAGDLVAKSHGIDDDGVTALQRGDAKAFVTARQKYLIARETEFQHAVGVVPSRRTVASAPIDTD